MLFRVGVNLGDIQEAEDGRVYGDGVNIAARLESLSVPGGVCISSLVREQIASRVDLPFADMGERRVKNVEKPIHAFAWGGVRSGNAASTPERNHLPTVAIKDFAVSGGDDAELLAAGVNNDVSMALSNQTGLELVSRSDRADYIIDAEFQARGAQYRANAKIFDRRTDHHFASKRFDGDLSDHFIAQEDLAYRMYSFVRLAIQDHELESAEFDGSDLDTRTLLNRAAHKITVPTSASYSEAAGILDVIISKEPRNFMAHAIRALSYLTEGVCGYRAVSNEDGAAAHAAIRTAIRLNEQSDFAHFVMGLVHMFVDGDWEVAKRDAERSLELNPYYPIAIDLHGTTLICEGQTNQGLTLLLKALEAYPRSSQNHWTLQRIALAEHVLGNYKSALSWAQRSDQRFPDVPRTLLTIASASALAGNEAVKRRAAERMMLHYPSFRVQDFGNWPFRCPEPADRIIEGLRLAGLPE